jgi:hypothetical protein
MSDAYVCYDYRDYEGSCISDVYVLHNLYNPNTPIHHLYTTLHNLYNPNTHIDHLYTTLHNLYNPNTCMSDVYVC